MKKLVVALLLTVAPVLMAATADSSVMSNPYGPNAQAQHSQAQNAANPQAQQHIQFLTDQQGPRQADDGMSLSSGMFGLSGPVSFVTTYSATYGWMLSGTYTQKIGQHNAVSLLLTGGANQQRANATWGIAVAKQQRVKLTAEYLRQDIDYDFYAGDKKEWEGQQAYGASYQYIIPHYWLNAINIDANYSLAQTRNLSTVLFDNDSLRNYRRIAGGRDLGMSAGVSLVPNAATSFDIAANYDDVKYNTKYQKHQDESGLGATLNLQHLITHRVKWQLLASQKVPVSTYGTELDYLLPSAAGTNLQLMVSANRDLGKGHLQNDFRVNGGLNYMWGGNPNGDANQAYQLGSVDSASDLNGWTSQPAVEKPQVLAVIDQKEEAVNNVSKQKHGLLNLEDCDPRAPHNNTSKPIPDQEITPGVAVAPKNLGLLSSPSASGGGFFTAGEIWPANAVTTTGLTGSLVMHARQANGTTTCQPSAPCYLWISGTPAADTVDGKKVTVNASGAQFAACPGQYKIFHLKLKVVGPSIVLNPKGNWILHQGATSISETATIDAGGNGDTIRSISIGNSAQGHNLAFYNIGDNAQSLVGHASGTLSFTVTAPPITKLTEDPNAVEDFPLAVTDNEGQTSHANLQIGIAGKPVTTGQTPAGQSKAIGGQLTEVDFTGAFKKPNSVSGNVTTYQLTITKPDGSTTTDPSFLNLAFNTTTGALTQQDGTTLPSVALGNYSFSVKATNNLGESDDAVAFVLTLQQGGVPTVVPTTGSGLNGAVVFTIGTAPVSDEGKVAAINAGRNNATVAQSGVVFNPALLDHGLSVDLSQTQAPSPTQPATYDAKFSGTPTNESTSVESYTIHVTNSDGQTADSNDNQPPQRTTLAFVVKGPPIRNIDSLDGGNINAGQAVNVPFPGHFTNNLPDYSGNMSFALCPTNSYSADSCVGEGQPGTDATHGLSVTGGDNPAVTGTLQASTTPANYNLYIFALNQRGGAGNTQGVSMQSVNFSFTVPTTNAFQCPTAAQATATMAADGQSFTSGGMTFSILAGAPHPISKDQFSNIAYYTGSMKNNNVQNRLSCVYALRGMFSGVFYNAENVQGMQPAAGTIWRGDLCGSTYQGVAHNPAECAITYSNRY